ncbi:MAG: TlpA family protein disulfide reductase [Planctomycetota bacterium]|nr:TlpA family protein disulfide reductase [Planctomycetota bacterium]
MGKFTLPILPILASVMIAANALALDLGDPAPEIAAEVWITGEPADPTKIDDKTIYLVEVWSTTCPPCVRTIPLLGSIQKRYADQGLKIISFTSDPVENVESFLTEHPMEYSSFIDKDGLSTVNYMAADNRDTIPHAFLFDRSGALVWIGNPLDNLESRIRKVIDGKLNRETALTLRQAFANLEEAFGEQDVDAMVESLQRLETLEPDNARYYEIHYRIITQLGFGDREDLDSLFRNWFNGCSDNPGGLAALSSLAISQAEPGQRNPGLALAAGKRAFAIGGETRFEAGLNLADIYKDIGRTDLALKLLDELGRDADPEQMEIIASYREFYDALVELGKNPDAEYQP